MRNRSFVWPLAILIAAAPLGLASLAWASGEEHYDCYDDSVTLMSASPTPASPTPPTAHSDADCPYVHFGLQVFGHDEQPVEGAAIYMVDEDRNFLDHETDAEGIAEFELEPGAYVYYIVPPEGMDLLPAHGSVDLHGDADGVMEAFFLPPAGSVSGIVLDSSGNPQPDVLLYLVEADDRCYYEEEGWDEHILVALFHEAYDDAFGQYATFHEAAAAFHNCGPTYHEAYTDEEGVFHFSGLFSTYHVLFGLDDDGTQVDLAEFEVYSGEHLDLGEFIHDAPGGIVGAVEGNGLDLEAAWAYVVLEDGEIAWSGLDEEGVFVIDWLYPGEYLLTIESNFAPYEMLVTVEGGEYTELDTIVLDDGVAVRGIVQAAGKPVAGAYVALFDAEGYGGATETDDKGAWEITGLVDGTYGYYVETEDSWFEVHAGDARAFVVTEASAASKTYSIEMPTLVTITGVVKDAKGKPVADAYVTAYNDDTGDYAYTDATGRYTMQVVTGDYWIYAESDDGDAYFAQQPTKATGTSVTVDVTFPSGGHSVSGKVLTPSGKPVAKAQVLVMLMDTKGEVVWSDLVVTDAKGNWEFPKLVEGTYKISADARRGNFVEETITVSKEIANHVLRVPKEVKA